jgi:tRNA(Ile)-lysidine synthase
MTMSRGPAKDDGVLRAIHLTLGATGEPVVLAVSGGLDSMVLLDAAARVVPQRIALVATFDHRSGAHSAQAVSLVRDEGARRGLRVVAGEASDGLHGEAAWRGARWAFLRRAARSAGAGVVTAHTLDDQLETVCIRVMRSAGARGLAGLYAPSPIHRPFLELRRADLEGYARARDVRHLEDPTNASRAYLRNRLRHDLLPAIDRVWPEFGAEMVALSRAAARLRGEVDAIAATLAVPRGPGAVTIEAGPLRDMSAEALRMLVPSLAARAGIVLDRRGTTRLAAFILEGRTGGRIQLAGGAEAMLTKRDVVVRRSRVMESSTDEMPLNVARITDAWRFRRVRRTLASDAWTADLPAESRLTVRAWRAGDRMRATGTSAARRVKRFFSDAGIVGPDRIGWPVVLADGEIIWIPGVRRSDAATDRSGRPVLRYRCERNDV